MHVLAEGLGPYREGLRALEASIRYPIADGADHFTIDHGAAYHPFFSNLGEAHFLLALSGDELVGSIVGVLRKVEVGAESVQALYLCDLKIDARFRGQGVARRMLQRGLWEIAKHPTARKCRLLYGAAMRGAGGDVMRSAKRFNPLQLGTTLANFALFFVAPEQLSRVAGAGPNLMVQRALALSPEGVAESVSTAGAKDLRMASTGKGWPLVHLTVAPWRTGSFGDYLRRQGLQLPAGSTACFALDRRLTGHLDWLATSGITPGAHCTVYGLALNRSIRRAEVAHLATSEI